MARRDFITVLGAAAVWPLTARAQQSAMQVIGLLFSTSPDTGVDRLRTFHRGLKESGYVEGENVAMGYGWAEGQYDRLHAEKLGEQLISVANVARRMPAE